MSIFPQHIIDQYNLQSKVRNVHVHQIIRSAIYVLPQAGALVNVQLRKFLAPEGYCELAHTPLLWWHVTRPIQFTLVVDDFGVKYLGQEHTNHLLNTIKNHYEVSDDQDGKL